VATTGGTSGDTELTLYNSAGTQIAYNNDYSGTFSQVSANLAAGTYYAKVNEYGNNATIASYTLALTGTTTGTATNYMLFTAWGGTWTDVDKSTTNTEDDLLCWAATTSNMLQWTGWGNAGGMTSADAIFTYFQNHWTDQGGHQYYGGDWWFDGTNTMQGTPGWAQVDVAGGGFYTSQNYGNYIHYSSTVSTSLSTISSYLRSGYAVGLGLSGPGGHAVACWGYEFTAGNTASYKGVYITDSDDNQSAPGSDYLRYYSVVQSNSRWYLQNYYGSNSWYISDVTGLDRRPSTVKATSAVAAPRLTLAQYKEAAQADVVDLAVRAETGVGEGQPGDEAVSEARLAAQSDAAAAVVVASVQRTASIPAQPADAAHQGTLGDSRSENAVALIADELPAHLRLVVSDAVFQAYL
jgi:hypothetical protein